MLSAAAIDDAENTVNKSSPRSKICSRHGDLAARGDHVLDYEDSSSFDRCTLGQLRRPIRFCLLADECGWQPRREGEGGRNRDAAQFQSGQNLDVVRDEPGQLVSHDCQKLRVGLEEVLIEVGG